MILRWHWADPGETVGWAQGRAESTEDDELKLIVEGYGQDKVQTYIMDVLKPQLKNLDLVGFENYYIRQSDLQAHMGSDVPTLQTIGMIRLAVWEEQDRRRTLFPRIEDQSPRAKATGMAAAKVHVPKLVPVIASAMTGKHDDGHYGDAILHAVAWFHTDVYRHGSH